MFRREPPKLIVLVAVAVLAAMVPLAWPADVGHAAPARPLAPLVEQASSPTTTLQPIAPCRLLDTRETPDAGRLDANTWRIQVTDRCGVPAGTNAVSLTLTVTETSGPGFVTAWPSGLPRPVASNVNYERGNTVANSAVVQLSGSGSVDVFVQTTAHLVVDVLGAFVPASAAGSGRLRPVDPVRLLDTRETGQRGTNDLHIPLPAGVDPDAVALAITVTVVDAAWDGFLTVYPAGSSRPVASVVNADTHNRTRATAVLAPISAGGFMIYRHMPTDVVIDMWGWFTGPSAPVASDGLFVPQAPTRVWDSRESFDPLHPGGAIEKQIAPAAASAVVANVTVVEPWKAGFISSFAAGTPRPNASTSNYRWMQPVPALAIARNSNRGVTFYAHGGGHMVVDVAGWFTGQPVAATLAPPSNPSPAPHTPVIFISDSSFAGIRWNGAMNYLQGASWDARLESCRRLIGASCRGREGYAPPTALDELNSLPYGYEVAIIVTGYNDYASMFPTALDAMIRTARAKGIQRVLWLTYRENVGYVSPSRISYAATFAANNRTLRAAVASGMYPELVLGDWNTYTASRPWWLTADGVHLTVAGAREAAIYTSRKLAALERRPCPAAIGGPTTWGGWCADPDLTGPP